MASSAGYAGVTATASPEVRSQNLRRAWHRFRQSRLSIVALGLVALIMLIAAIGPFLVPYPGDATGAIHVTSRLQPPSATHLLGTDSVGRDIFTRVIVGARISLLIAILVVPTAAAFGSLLGAVAGHAGSVVGELIMRLTDVFMTIPALLLSVTLAAALGPSLTNTAIAIAVVRWPLYTRLLHGEVLRLRDLGYVEAARSHGASAARVLIVHILPNTVSAVVVQMSLDLGFVILTTASLGFLGLGVSPPTPEWGTMVSDGRSSFPAQWWPSAVPGLAIFVSVLALNLLGDGLRDLLDPRTRR